MRHGLLLLSLLAAAVATAGAVDVPALIEAAPPADAFADQDVVVLHAAEDVTVDADGRVTRRVHTVRRLQTQWAMRRTADVRVAWDRTRQNLEVLTSRTFMRDGTVLETPDNGFNEVTPSAVQRAVPFLDIREMVITHIGTEPGCVVELEYVLRDREPAAIPPLGTVWLGGEHPVLRAECTVRGDGVEVVTATGLEATGEGSDTGQWRFEATDLPAFAELPGDQWSAVVPRVHWSAHARLAAGRSDLVRAVGRASAPVITAGPRLAAWLDETRSAADVLGEADLLERIATLVHDHIATVDLPTGPWSRAPRPAEAVYTSAVGTDWERALVAMTLLREAGFEPELGLFGRQKATDAQGDPFSHWRAVCRIGDQNWWLGPDRGTAWTGRCDLADHHGVFLALDGSLRAYQVQPRPLHCRWRVHLAPEGDGWRAEADLELSGLAPGDQAPRELAERLAGRLLEAGELGELDLRHSGPGRVSMRFAAHGPDLAPAAQGARWYEVPWPDPVVLPDLLGQVDLDRAVRAHPVRLDRAAALEATVTVDLPEGWRIDRPRALPTPASVGPLTVEQAWSEDDGGMRQRTVIALAAAPIDPASWPVYRESALATLRLVQRPLVVIASP
ncbi:DUF3857 domain-containing protein [bacterium]|nr:DUF3857 domain-containing protein [bacterium]